MTTESRPAPVFGSVVAGASLLLVAIWGVVACAGTHETRRGDRVDVSSYPLEIQQAYRVFERRCTRCHTLARPLNARIRDPQHWVRYVARMRRNPSSGINHKDADVILRFLLFYTQERARADAPPEDLPPSSAAPATNAPSDPAAPIAAPDPQERTP